MYFWCGEGHLTISASFSQTEPANQMTQPMYSLLITYKRMPNRQLPVTVKRVCLSSEYQPKHSEMLLLYVCTQGIVLQCISELTVALTPLFI